MLKRDPYNHKERWERWKEQKIDVIDGISKYNSGLILTFLSDMEMGKNVSPISRKGERSVVRLNNLRGKMIFFAEYFDKNLDQLNKDEIHKLFFDMRSGVLKRKDGKIYLAVGEYVKDFKAFWSWLKRTGKTTEDIAIYLRRSDGRKPPWVYLTEEQFKTLANAANHDYRALLWLMYDTGMRITEPAAFNKYLRNLAKNIFGTSETPARKPYDKMRLYDIRHNACCYWLKRYPTTTSLMYRMGWSEEKEVRYYSEFLGQADAIDDDNMITTEEKTKYEKRIELLENDRQKTNELVNELIKKIADLQVSLKN